MPVPIISQSRGKYSVVLLFKQIRNSPGSNTPGRNKLKRKILLEDNSVWISCVFECLLSRGIESFCPDYVFKDICIANNLGRER